MTAFVLYRPLQYVPGFLFEKISHDSDAVLYRPLPYAPEFLCEKISHDSNYVLYRVLTGLIRYRIRFLVSVDNCSWMIFHSHELGSRLLTFFSFFLPGISS